MTTLAIVGGGIVGRSLLYNLTSDQNSFKQILFFESEDFAFPCSLHSTAIVAKRGVTAGHSPLGDKILKGLECFSAHAEMDMPKGIFFIKQFSGAETKLEQFKTRYPDGRNLSRLNDLEVRENYFAQEEAYLIDPALYLDWLFEKAQASLPVKRISDFVIGLEKGQKIKLKTQSGLEFEVDQVVMAVGSQSSLWKNLLPATKLESSKPVQGAYWEFSKVGWGTDSFSITWEGQNLIYHSHTDKLLMGSTTNEWTHSLPDVTKLQSIYNFFQERVRRPLPDLKQGKILVGHREKASKREPYLIQEENIFFIGGMYKNGYTLSLEMTRSLHRLLLRA